jgi:Mg-chelatase subunit ChlD
LKNNKLLIVIFAIFAIFAILAIPYAIYSNNGMGPHLEVEKSVDPTTINCEVATVTLNVSGKGEISVEHNPIDVMLIIDRSGSMAGTKIAGAKTAAKTFTTFLVENDSAGLVSYSTTATLDQGLKLMDTSNKTSLNSSIDSLTAGGTTNIGDAIYTATGEFLSNGRTNPVIWAEILLTDGQANEPFNDAPTYNQDIEYAVNASINASEEGIIIYTIGLGSDADNATLKEIANKTGGQYFFAPDTTGLEQIYKKIAETLFNTTAGASVIIDDILPSYVNLVSGLPPECTYYISNKTISCNVGTMKINDTYNVSFDVDITMLGSNLVNVYPDSGVHYIDYLGNDTFVEFPATYATVTGYLGATEICDDGYDNDCDELVDCADPDCAGQAGPGGVICCQEGNQCSQSTEKCDYNQRIYCTRDEFGMCVDNICVEDEWTCGNPDDVDYCTNCDHCGDGACNCNEIIANCPEDCLGLIPKICVWGRDIVVNGINILDARVGQYAFTGEQIKFNITVRDPKGAEDIGYVKLLVEGEQEVLCNPIFYNGSCNGFGNFTNETDRAFKCELTVEPTWYGEEEITIAVYDINNNMILGNHKEIWFFNPGISLDVNTTDGQPIQFEEGGAGDIVHSINHIIVKNLGDGGLNLWMYIAGTDLYGIGAAKCPKTNKIDIENWMQFRGWTGTISGNWTYMSEYDENDGCKLFGTCYGGLPVPENATNVLTNNDILEVEFKLEYPMPCIGKFDDGSIIIIGKPI